MSNPSLFIDTQVPEYYNLYYSKFVDFIKAYYDWQYRKQGLSSEELIIIQQEQNWLEANIEKYNQTGMTQYSGFASSDEALIDIANSPSSGGWSDDLVFQYFLERTFSLFSDNEETIFQTADGYNYSAPNINEDVVNLWFNKLGFDQEYSYKSDLNADPLLLIKCLKYIYSIKGTETATKLFFQIYFGEDVEIYIPKFDIAYIDDNFILDGVDVARDDYRYQEYSVVVYVSQDPSIYQYLINKIFNVYFKPSGFLYLFEQKS